MRRKKIAAAPKRPVRKAIRKPQPGSLAWFREEWRLMARGVEIPEAFLTGLAQLSYENKKIWERLEVMESVQTAQLFGKEEDEEDAPPTKSANRDSTKEN